MRPRLRFNGSMRSALKVAFLISISCIALLHSQSTAQWISNGPYGGVIQGFTPYKPNPSIVFAEGVDAIFRSNNYGNTWNRIYPFFFVGSSPKVRVSNKAPWKVIEAGDEWMFESN